jgi:hypothetical protein
MHALLNNAPPCSSRCFPVELRPLQSTRQGRRQSTAEPAQRSAGCISANPYHVRAETLPLRKSGSLCALWQPYPGLSAAVIAAMNPSPEAQELVCCLESGAKSCTFARRCSDIQMGPGGGVTSRAEYDSDPQATLSGPVRLNATSL